MDKIEHTKVTTNGINMHVASIGQGQPILFLHGFPELWYSWRHQLLSLSSLGYRCIAPDLRGYGDTDVPASISDYTIFHLVGDLVGLLDALGIEQVFLVGHDWGAIIAWSFCMFRPDRIKALVNTSVPFLPRNPLVKTLEGFKAESGDDFYMSRFQEPGEVEKEFAQVEAAELLTKFLASRETKPPVVPKEIGFHRLPNPPSLPSWLSQEDVSYYASKFDKTGFTGGLNYYRNLDRNWELSAPWTGAQIKVPTKFIVGELDLVLGFPGTKEYVTGGGMKKDVPSLEEVAVLEGVAHYLTQEAPDQEPGEAEKLFAQVETPKLMRMFLASWSPQSPRIPKEGWPHGDPNPPNLPWLSEEDVNYYASKFDKTGFSGGLNYYRNLNRSWELTAPWTGFRVEVPTKFIVGELDVTRHEFPGMKEYMDSGELKKDVPNLEDVVVLEGVAHFLNQEKPDEVNNHIYEFIKKF